MFIKHSFFILERTDLDPLEVNQVDCTGRVKESPARLDRRCCRKDYSLCEFSSQRCQREVKTNRVCVKSESASGARAFGSGFECVRACVRSLRERCWEPQTLPALKETPWQTSDTDRNRQHLYDYSVRTLRKWHVFYISLRSGGITESTDTTFENLSWPQTTPAMILIGSGVHL